MRVDQVQVGAVRDSTASSTASSDASTQQHSKQAGFALPNAASSAHLLASRPSAFSVWMKSYCRPQKQPANKASKFWWQGVLPSVQGGTQHHWKTPCSADHSGMRGVGEGGAGLGLASVPPLPMRRQYHMPLTQRPMQPSPLPK